MARKAQSTKPDILDTALKLVGERGWRDVQLGEIADAANVSLADLHRRYHSKRAILVAFIRRIDEAVLAGGVEADPDETPRDRLFEILMRRFDALTPYKPAIAALSRELPRDPATALALAPVFAESMSWMLAAAGLSPQGLRALATTKGLMAVWAATLRVWLEDDSPDMAQTMAALDRNLGRAERAAQSLCRRPGRRGGDRAADAEAEVA